MVTLYQFPPIPGLESISPFCLKVRWALAFGGVSFETRHVMSAAGVAETRRLPALDVGGERIEDSTLILRHLDTMAISPKLYPVDAGERVRVDLIEDWADETLHWYAVYYRYADAANFAALVDTVFAPVPKAFRAMTAAPLQQNILRHLESVGIGLRSRSQVDDEFERHLGMIDQMLTRDPYLTGDQPNAADIAVGAQLVVLTTGITELQHQAIRAHPRIDAWLSLLIARFANGAAA